MKCLLFAITLIVLTTGCQPASNDTHFETDLSSTESIPETFEQPVDEEIAPVDSNNIAPTEVAPTASEQTPATFSTLTASASSTRPTALSKASGLIKNAEKVMQLEGKKIGTACNRYVERVLEVSGFTKKGFLANDFDLYAKKYINHYRALNFDKDRSGQSAERLHDYIWSFPERTPFILQWSRAGAYGHIALMERVGDKLIIYQASLHQHTARKDQTTIKTLLSGYNRRTLTVYTELTP